MNVWNLLALCIGAAAAFAVIGVKVHYTRKLAGTVNHLSKATEKYIRHQLVEGEPTDACR